MKGKKSMNILKSEKSHPNSLFCVLPPHILHEIAKRGTRTQRETALDTLGRDHSLRFGRASFQLLATNAQKLIAAPTVGGEAQITIYDAQQRERLPGRVVPNPNESDDAEVSEALKGLLATYAFYWEVFKRNSIDDHGLPLIGSVHYSSKYDNAFWNGQQMVFGDGDGEIFRRFTISIDVIGHELTHGVTGDTANLDYQAQPGALNESVSDVFGSMVKQYSSNPRQNAGNADWLIGAGVFMPNIKGKALRSMGEPGSAYDDPTLGKDPQPGTMADYAETDQDNGGVHINSGIPNRAFYLAATKLGGYSWDKAGLIWYAALRDQALRPTAKFADFANITVANANRLFGAAEAQIVRDAWKQVGVL
jgi:Zn-dependent metalloprotease